MCRHSAHAGHQSPQRHGVATLGTPLSLCAAHARPPNRDSQDQTRTAQLGADRLHTYRLMQRAAMGGGGGSRVAVSSSASLCRPIITVPCFLVISIACLASLVTSPRPRASQRRGGVVSAFFPSSAPWVWGPLCFRPGPHQGAAAMEISQGCHHERAARRPWTLECAHSRGRGGAPTWHRSPVPPQPRVGLGAHGSSGSVAGIRRVWGRPVFLSL